MLVELVLRPLTFCGAPSGSDKQDDSDYDTQVYSETLSFKIVHLLASATKLSIKLILVLK